MIFYAKDFGILPDSETAKKLDTVFSEMAKTCDKKTIKSSIQKKKNHFVKAVNCKNLVIEQ